MKNIRLISSLLCLIGCTFLSFNAHAEQLFKRIKCADATSPQGNGLHVFYNKTTFSKYIVVQIVRDGCRPKGTAGTFAIVNTDFYETTSGPAISMIRMGRNSSAVFREIPAGHVARIRFFPGSNVKAGGTFDLLVEID